MYHDSRNAAAEQIYSTTTFYNNVWCNIQIGVVILFDINTDSSIISLCRAFDAIIAVIVSGVGYHGNGFNIILIVFLLDASASTIRMYTPHAIPVTPNLDFVRGLHIISRVFSQLVNNSSCTWRGTIRLACPPSTATRVYLV